MGEKEDDKTGKKPAGPGGVKHDARGNAVWQWAADSGRHAIATTSRLLERLEVPGMRLEDDPEVLKAKADAQQSDDQAGPVRGAGYDPYGGAGAGAAPKVAANPPQAAKPSPATKPATAAKPAPSLLRRLFRRD